jgi:hypothetical protein
MPNLQSIESVHLAWKCGSSAGVPALQVQNSEFKTKSHKKKKRKKEKKMYSFPN